MKKTIVTVGAFGLLAAGVVGARTALAQEKGRERSITLPQMEPNLPAAPGREAVIGGCVICHSTRYITMQPAFSREAWTAEVEKMRKVFGAPVANEQAPVIVDYLVAIRGAKGAGKP